MDNNKTPAKTNISLEKAAIKAVIAEPDASQSPQVNTGKTAAQEKTNPNARQGLDPFKLFEESSKNEESKPKISEPIIEKKPETQYRTFRGVTTNSKFFIALGKNGVHSTINIGFINPNRKPIIFATFGKTKRGLQKDGITLDTTNLKYKAWDLNFKQVQETFGLLRDVYLNQSLSYYNVPINYPLKGEDTKIEWARANIDEVLLDEKPIILPTKTKLTEQEKEAFVQDLEEYKFFTNNCRNGAKKFIEKALGFEINVSDNALSNPSYSMNIESRNDDYYVGDTQYFYSLPSPPNNLKSLSTSQQKMAKKIYDRLEKIPESRPNDKETFEKFNSLKNLYLDIVKLDQELNNKNNPNSLINSNTAAELFTLIDAYYNPEKSQTANKENRKTNPNLPTTPITQEDKQIKAPIARQILANRGGAESLAQKAANLGGLRNESSFINKLGLKKESATGKLLSEIKQSLKKEMDQEIGPDGSSKKDSNKRGSVR